jgi:hypothetical protein
MYDRECYLNIMVNNLYLPKSIFAINWFILQVKRKGSSLCTVLYIKSASKFLNGT